MAASRHNTRYLPRLRLSDSIHMTSNLGDLQSAELLVFVVPSKGLRESAAQVAQTGLGQGARAVVSCVKGIEMGSCRRMSEILGEHFPHTPLVVLSGPNHAEEVAQRLATAAVVASVDGEMARQVQACFTLPWFRSYTSDDITGVEWAGALKNPYAIAAGIARGMHLGDNAIAALVTRALAEMVRLGTVMGGCVESFYGLSGVGDLVATCYSEHSRNHRLGQMLGQGKALDDIIASTRMVAEGVLNTASLHAAARDHGVRMPLLDEINAILHQGKPVQAAMRALLSRDPRPETD